MSRVIGIDWGSTNLRAYRYAADGSVCDRRRSPCGIVTIADGGFAAVLFDLAGDWIDDGSVVVMAGMIGSRDGWREAPYVPCPADRATIARALVAVALRRGRGVIVPGVVAGGGGTPADVMRGEETQAFGAGIADGRVVLPGTHSKWVDMAGGRIVALRTVLTGELYALLRDHSLLGRVAPAAAFDDAAFARGVARSLADPAITTMLFSARAERLTGHLAGDAVAAYLSGLLIGAEVAAMVPRGTGPLTIVGGADLAARYRTAFALAGIADVATVDGDAAVAAGLWDIGKALP